MHTRRAKHVRARSGLDADDVSESNAVIAGRRLGFPRDHSRWELPWQSPDLSAPGLA